MTTSDSSETVEQRLRQAFVSTRPAGGLGSATRKAILDIPASAPAHGAIARLGRSVTVLAAAAAVGALAIVLAAVGIMRVPIEGLTPPNGGAPPNGFDPAITGSGLIAGVPPTAMLLGLALVLLGGGTAVANFISNRSATNRGRVLVLAGIAAVLAGIWLVRFDVGLRVGSLRAGLLGYVEAPAGPLDQALVYVSTASPGQTSVGIFSLRNTAALPVRIEGLVVSLGNDALASGRWAALWMPPGGAGYDAPPLDQVRPFEPVTLGPGEEINVYAAVRAGNCAFGPSFDPTKKYSDAELVGYSQLGPDVTIAYSVFGLASTAQIDIDEAFAEPIRANCFQ